MFFHFEPRFGVKKNGDWQPNLTAGVEQEALAYVLKKQKELDDEKAKSKAKN